MTSEELAKESAAAAEQAVKKVGEMGDKVRAQVKLSDAFIQAAPKITQLIIEGKTKAYTEGFQDGLVRGGLIGLALAGASSLIAIWVFA